MTECRERIGGDHIARNRQHKLQHEKLVDCGAPVERRRIVEQADAQRLLHADRHQVEQHLAQIAAQNLGTRDGRKLLVLLLGIQPIALAVRRPTRTTGALNRLRF